MIQLTVLGDLELRREDGPMVGSVLSQPRRLALLVYLAVESAGGGVQRDRLLGIFWPDLPQDQARQSLRTALHFLRRSLGAGSLEGEGSSIRLDPDHIACDATRFVAALRAGDAAAALQLYRGDLLPGFYLDDGPPEFERWLDGTRSALRRQAADAAWSLAEAEEAAGNAPGAGAWARTAARLFEEDEAAVRRSIELLDRIGDRTGALVAYQDLVRKLSDDFDATPSPATEAVLARVRAGEAAGTRPDGAPLAAGEMGSAATQLTPEPVVQEAVPALAVEDRAVRPWRTVARRASRGVYSTAVTITLMAAFYSLWGLGRSGPTPAMAGIERTAVLQIEEIRDFSADGATTDLAGALTLELASRLGEIHSMQVLAAGGEARTGGAAPGYILRGGLIRSDSVVRLTAMLLDGSSGATLDRITAEGDVGNPTVVTAELAEVMARRIRREIGRVLDDRERDANARNPYALNLVRAALRDMAVADSLRTAGALDAAALSLESADAQFARAQAEAPRWPEPSVQRAELAYRRMWLHLLPPNRDVDAAGRALKGGLGQADAALGIGADDPAALELRGLLNYWRWRLRSGTEEDHESARRHAEADLLRATALDGSRGRAWGVLSALHEARGDFAAANLAARRAHRADPYLENANEIVVRLFNTSLEIGDAVAANRWCEELGRLGPQSWLKQYCVVEQMAWYGPPAHLSTDELHTQMESARASRGAIQVAAELEMLYAVIQARLGSPAAAASIRAAADMGEPGNADLLAMEAWAHLTLGDPATAIALVERAITAGPREARRILLSRRFEVLRNDSRFQDLLTALP